MLPLRILRSPPLIRHLSVSAMQQKTGIVFMNMGGPSKTEETYDFLLRLFQDKDIIPLGRFQNVIGRLIALKRYKAVENNYKDIGGGSPIKKFSQIQAEGVCKILDVTHPQTAPHVPYIMFRYAHPLTEDTYKQMLQDGVTRAVAFSQYPQYSYSTTQSNINEMLKWKKILDTENQIEWSTIWRWPTHPQVIKVLAKHIRSELLKFPEPIRNDIKILFSAHSLPMSVVNQGDPYVGEVAATVYAVMQELKFCNPYRLTWQSQVGPIPWLGAQTQDSIQKLEKDENYKGVVLVPVAFTSDHIETLHEVDIEMKEAIEKKDLMRRSESLNDDPEFIEGLADIVLAHLENDHDSQVVSGAAIPPVFDKLG